MPIGALNSPLSKKGYTTPEMEAIWSESRSLQRILDVESALVKVQASLGVVPAQAASAIAKAAQVTPELVERVEAGKVGNPLVAALDALRAQVPADARGWVHYGATSQDILDTARGLQIHEGIDRLLGLLSTLDEAVSALAVEHADTVMVARTNGQYALPTTLGMRFARWLGELRRAESRLQQVRARAELIQFSGAAGTYASMGAQGEEVSRQLAAELGLVFEEIPWHASRDGITELCCDCALLGQTLAKCAEDLFDMQQSDIAEAHESMDAHSSGSSTMPQKLNPFTTMKISVGARLATNLAAGVLTQPPGSFERDHRQLEVERDAVPQIFVAIDGALVRLINLIPRLSFDRQTLEAKVNAGGVLLVTEAIMMSFAKSIGQERAHDLLQSFAKEHRQSNISLRGFLESQPGLLEELGSVDLESLEDPRNYLGLSRDISMRVGRKNPHEATSGESKQ